MHEKAVTQDFTVIIEREDETYGIARTGSTKSGMAMGKSCNVHQL